MSKFAMCFDPGDRSFAAAGLDQIELRAGEVLVKVSLCTICGSDLHTVCGRRSAPGVCVLGHEIVGEVQDWKPQAGPGPTDFLGAPLSKGQRITWAMAVGCGECFFCSHNLNQKCSSLFKYGHQSFQSGRPTGGFSTHCVLVPGTPIFTVPDDLPDEVVCPANCATATVSAALRVADLDSGCDIAIITGAGMLGMTAAAQLQALYAPRAIVVVDPNRRRLEIATRFGATHTIGPDDQVAVAELVSGLSDGRGADLALEFSGQVGAVRCCLDTLRVGGTAVLAGSVFPGPAIELVPEQIVRRMINIRGIHNYVPADLQHAIEFLQRHQDHYPFASLVGERYRLVDLDRGIDTAVAGTSVRVAVEP